MNRPLVSVIISAYNAERYVAQTIDAVLAQTWSNLEIIVVNDGSTDNTRTVLNAYADKVIIVDQENKGQDAALNTGYRHSKGAFVKFMDSDDLINPEMIELQVKTLEGSNDDYVAYGEWSRFYHDDLSTADFAPLSYWRNMAPLDFLTADPDGVMLQCGIMLVPRKLIEKAGLWDERLILGNDTEFYTRILINSKGVLFSKNARLFYRSGITTSISVQKSYKFFESTFLAATIFEKYLLEAEDSVRVRNLISNAYLDYAYQMYPNFPELFKKHEEKIKEIGFGTRKLMGGKYFILCRKLFGWKNAKKLQLLINKVKGLIKKR